MLFYFSSLFFCVAPYVFCLCALLCDGGKDRLRELRGSLTAVQILLICFFALGMTAVAVFWIHEDRYVYFWDQAGYWMKSVGRARHMAGHGAGEVLLSLVRSINEEDYNDFLPTVIAFPLLAFGFSYQTYVLVNFLVFQIPVSLLMALAAGKTVQAPAEKKARFFVLAFFLALIIPINYYAIFRGYIDTGFLLFAGTAAWLLTDYDFGKVSVVRDLFLALLFVLTWICRRYTVFLLIGFVAFLLVKAVFALVRKPSDRKKVLLNFLIIGGVSLGILLLFFRDFFLHALLTDYGSMYSAYDAPLKSKISGVVHTCGLLLCIVCILGDILCLLRKDWEDAACWTAMLVTETAVFWRTQAMGTQHMMILTLPVYMLCMKCFGLPEPEEGGGRSRRGYAELAVGLLCAACFLYNFMAAFIPKASFLPGELCADRYTALQRDDIPVLRSMAEDLNELTEDRDEDIYVAASGVILNSGILSNLNLPEIGKAVPRLLPTHDVDLRDGFPTDFLTAGYVVAAEPAETHLASGQEVVSWLSQSVQDETSCIGKHYTLIREYELDGGVRAKVYQKTGEYAEEDLQTIRDHYAALYPGQEELFAEQIRLPD